MRGFTHTDFEFETISGPLDVRGFADDQNTMADQLMSAAEVKAGKVYFTPDGYANGRPRFSFTVAEHDGLVRAEGFVEILPACTSEELEQIGEALYGVNWQSNMARALDMNVRSIQRFAAGTHSVQSHTLNKILDVVRTRRDALDGILKRYE